jgi:hypothetical protein
MDQGEVLAQRVQVNQRLESALTRPHHSPERLHQMAHVDGLSMSRQQEQRPVRDTPAH